MTSELKSIDTKQLETMITELGNEIQGIRDKHPEELRNDYFTVDLDKRLYDLVCEQTRRRQAARFENMEVEGLLYYADPGRLQLHERETAAALLKAIESTIETVHTDCTGALYETAMELRKRFELGEGVDNGR